MLLFDLETDGFLEDVTKIHCAVTYDTDTQEYKRYRPEDIDTLIDDLKGADSIGAHNGINYDIPVIEKLYGIDLYKECKVLDTFVLSRIAYYNLMNLDEGNKSLPPAVKGSHSLKAWGMRLGEYKGEYGSQDNAWDTFNEEMLDYCEQDVKVTVKLYERLLKKNVPDSALDVEQDFAYIINRQSRYGWYFDIEKAQFLHVELNKQKEAIEKELEETFKPLKDWVAMKEVPQYRIDGVESKNYLNQVKKGAHRDPKLGWGRWEETWFNPSSRHHIIRWMKEVYNWDSPKKTDKGTPIINEDTLKNCDIPEAQLLRKYFLLQKVLGMLVEGANGWLRLVKDDNRIHGQVNTLGAVTGRCTHNKPNVAQTPSSRAFMGKECRQLFTVPEGKKIVGVDASGLELRMLAHYMAAFDGGAYGEQVVNGDIHTINQEAAGLPTRDNAKTFIYGFLYGAGNAKIGSIVGGSQKVGKNLKETFLKRIPALAKLTTAVKKSASKGFLLGLNKRKYEIRSDHAALNVLLQGAGALVMKYYLVELDKKLQETMTPGKEYEFIGNIHDEVQMEVDENKAEIVKEIAESTFADVEKLLNFRVKLEGEAKIGNTWYDTH